MVTVALSVTGLTKLQMPIKMIKTSLVAISKRSTKHTPPANSLTKTWTFLNLTSPFSSLKVW